MLLSDRNKLGRFGHFLKKKRDNLFQFPPEEPNRTNPEEVISKLRDNDKKMDKVIILLNLLQPEFIIGCNRIECLSLINLFSLGPVL